MVAKSHPVLVIDDAPGPIKAEIRKCTVVPPLTVSSLASAIQHLVDEKLTTIIVNPSSNQVSPGEDWWEKAPLIYRPFLATGGQNIGSMLVELLWQQFPDLKTMNPRRHIRILTTSSFEGDNKDVARRALSFPGMEVITREELGKDLNTSALIRKFLEKK